MNKKAIVTYVDHNKLTLEEFTWLCKSWFINDLHLEYDIVAYCNPKVIEFLPEHKNIIVKPLRAMQDIDPFWDEYRFVNSFAMFNDEEECKWITDRYDYILKTDADVFLTKNLMGLDPVQVMIGYGGYMANCGSPIIKENLARIAKDLNLNDHGINHVGASIFAKSYIAIKVIQDHFKLTKHILMTEWRESEGMWPCWFKGVSSMYAIHLAVNHNLAAEHVNAWSLDTICGNNIIDKATYHIHAWHTKNDFSKHKWFRNKYKPLKTNQMPTIAKDYCLWIASNSVEDLLKVK